MPTKLKDRDLRKSATCRAKDENASRYDNWTVYELKTRVKELGMGGYFDKSRAELIEMLRDES